MDKNAIQKYAIWARNELIGQVKQRAFQYGISDKGYGEENASVINGRVLSPDEKRQRQDFVHEIQKNGFEQAVEEVAYTWFNRFIALRFMEVNDYLPTHVRVLSDASGGFNPEILKDVLHLDMEGLDKAKVSTLLNANQTEELYRYLLLTQCNALSTALPEMFEKLGSYTEMLLPNNILKQDSILAHLVKDIDEDDWKDAVQIIGWMYQYYITEINQIVYDGTFSKERIPKELLPAATTIYTPDWAIRYMVDNSLGKMFVYRYPQLREKLKYYINSEPVENNVRVEDVRLLDCCMGSGHILVYAFDVLVQIYIAEGYAERDAAKMILENNIYGLDIDKRAYQLSYFALMMKARQYNRRILDDRIKPQVYCPAGDRDGEEYGSILRIDNLEPHPEEQKAAQQTLFDIDYALKLNAWNFRRVLSQKYDVVVTNPPYLGSGRFSPKLLEYVNTNYPDAKSDLSMAMYKHALQDLSKKNGYVSFITTSSWMFLSSFEKLRSYVLKSFDFDSIVDFGSELFDGKVGHNLIVAWVNRNSRINKKMTAIRLVDYCYGRRDEKEPEFFNLANRHIANADNFAKIPGSPVAYWVSEAIGNDFANNKKLKKYVDARIGLVTGDNDRFLRLWTEVDYSKLNHSAIPGEAINEGKWFPIQKGGDFRLWYGNYDTVVNWENDGYVMKNDNYSGNRVRAHNFNGEQQFKEGLTYNSITSSRFSCRYSPKGFSYNVAGPIIEVLDGNNIFFVLGFLASKVADYLLKLLNPTINFTPGYIEELPFIVKDRDDVNGIVQGNISISKTDWDAFETSWDFKRHPLIYGKRTVETAFGKWEREAAERFDTLKANEEELNRIFIDIYGLQDELTPDVEEKDVTVRPAKKEREIRSFISYTVGCMFGRYSLDTDGLAYAGGDWDASKYSTFIPDKDNILPICDDEYFEDDIVGRFVDFIRVAYSAETLEENLKFIADALGGKGTPREVIRSYFLNDFYADHCKIYQKRPIYWLFDSGKKNGFKALVYLHRYSRDLLAKMRTDYVHEQQERYRTQLSHIAATLNTATGAERVKLLKQQDKLAEQLKEITTFEEKVHHLADQNITIDLDDGVKKNYEIFVDVLAKI